MPACNGSDRASGEIRGNTEPEKVLTLRCAIAEPIRGGPAQTTLHKEVDAAMATARPIAATRAVSVTTVQRHQDGNWSSIDWKAANLEVERLQQRVFRASQQGQWREVRSLQKLLLRSYSNLVLSVRHVTQVASGKKTPGVDGRVALDAKSRVTLVHELQQTPMTRSQPVKRVYIPKASGKRPLGIPTVSA